MNAIELKFRDGKRTGLWYCGKCREIHCRRSKWSAKLNRDTPRSEDNREEAECCCTANKYGDRWGDRTCTGCREALSQCKCGRAAKNLCAGCSRKLFYREGIRVRWGAGVAEMCADCAKKLPASELMDAPQ